MKMTLYLLIPTVIFCPKCCGPGDWLLTMPHGRGLTLHPYPGLQRLQGGSIKSTREGHYYSRCSGTRDPNFKDLSYADNCSTATGNSYSMKELSYWHLICGLKGPKQMIQFR